MWSTPTFNGDKVAACCWGFPSSSQLCSEHLRSKSALSPCNAQARCSVTRLSRPQVCRPDTRCGVHLNFHNGVAADEPYRRPLGPASGSGGVAAEPFKLKNSGSEQLSQGPDLEVDSRVTAGGFRQCAEQAMRGTIFQTRRDHMSFTERYNLAIRMTWAGVLVVSVLDSCENLCMNLQKDLYCGATKLHGRKLGHDDCVSILEWP